MELIMQKEHRLQRTASLSMAIGQSFTTLPFDTPYKYRVHATISGDLSAEKEHILDE
jgi:hypothetical protein